MDSHELPGLATEKWSIVPLSRQSWRWLIGKSALGRPALAMRNGASPAIFKKLKKRPESQVRSLCWTAAASDHQGSSQAASIP